MIHDVDRASESGISRRALFKQAGAGLLGGAAWSALGAPAPESETKRAATIGMGGLNRFPTMLQEYFVRRLREVDALATQQRVALRTKADAEAYVQEARRKIRLCFGTLPEKTPLNPRITRVVERAEYRIENVIFDSRPNFPVTANLYVPAARARPLPGVIGCCGHSANGKARDTYQSFAQGLARQGYVVLLFDSIGMGERLQYLTPALDSSHGAAVGEHVYAGNQQMLVGEFLGTWLAWDGVRALDYLLTRPEVDPHHIGVTGTSGGGTLTAWLCGLDDRWTMAAPSCFVTSFRRNLENELPGDIEQCPPGALALGLDHADFIAALAPKPVILLGQEKDYFDARGLEEAFGRLQHLYRLLGAEQNIQLCIGPDYHSYSTTTREAMYRWFNRITQISAAVREPSLTLERDETLWCTPRGQVGATGAKTVADFTRESSQAWRSRRRPLEGDALQRAITSELTLPPAVGIPDYRILRPLASRGYPREHAAVYAIETEPSIFAVVYRLHDQPIFSRPPRGSRKAFLYVAHQSADDELRGDPWLAELVRAEPEVPLFACDVRGIGESRPNTTARDFLHPVGNDYFYAAHAVMLQFPLAAQRTHDLIRVVDWLGASGHDEVHLVGRGWGAIPAALAAVLAHGVKRITLKNALTSWADLAESAAYRWPLAMLPFGVLKAFDLPDCYRELAKKNLRQIEPWGASAGKT